MALVSEIEILQRTERFVVRTMCGAGLKDPKITREFMAILKKL